MLEAKQRSDWAHTANLMTLLVNINKDPKKGRRAKFEEFFPFPIKRETKQDIPKVGVDVLIQLWSRTKPPPDLFTKRKQPNVKAN